MTERIEVGQMIETEIVAISGDCVFLDLNAKSEGIANVSDFLDNDGKITVKEGDKVKVFFTGLVNGEMRFAAKISGSDADFSMLENAWKSEIPVTGKVEKEIKGGYEIKIGGARAFCPYSQMGFKQKENAENYVGRTLQFFITEFKDNGKNLLVSNRRVGEIEHNENLAKLSEKIKVDSVVTGTVEEIKNFGAFINLYGFRALLPISEIQFDKVDDISQVLSIGQEISAKVISTDWKNEKVSVSMKALLDDPWESVSAKIHVGEKYEGKISRITDFGVFINLASGIDGLVHISALENVSKNTNIKKVYKIGAPMSVVVKEMEIGKKRISLIPASSAEQDMSAQKYMATQTDDDSDGYNPFAGL